MQLVSSMARHTPSEWKPRWAALFVLAAVPLSVASLEDALGVTRDASFYSVEADILRDYDSTDNFADFRDLYNSTGAGTVRVPIRWRDISTGPGAYDFSLLDQVIGAVRSDVQIVATLFTIPDWANVDNYSADPTARWRASYPADDINDWTDYVEAVTDRYQDRIDLWEVWNEPDNPDFFSPTPDPDLYLPILKSARDVIKATDSDSIVAVGGMSTNGIRKNRWFADAYGNFMPDLYQAIEDLGDDPDDYFDVVAIHPYWYPSLGETVQTMNDMVDEITDLMDSKGDSEKPLWVTEFGFTLNNVDEATQAAALTESLEAFASNERIDLASCYILRDIGNGHLFGLYDSDSNPRQALSAYRAQLDGLSSYIVFNGGTTDWTTETNWHTGDLPDLLDVAAVDTSAVIGVGDNIGVHKIAIGRDARTSSLTIGSDYEVYVTDDVNLDYGNAEAAGSATLSIASDVTVDGIVSVGLKNAGQTAGSATLNITGGSVNVGNSLYTANSAASTGVYTINVTGGVLEVANELTLSHAVNSDSTLNISGDAVVKAYYIRTGEPGTNDFSGTISVTGSSATIEAGESFLLKNDSSLALTFDEGGISTIDAGLAFWFANVANLTIDGNGYNTPGIIDLVVADNAGSLFYNTFDDVMISGFGPGIANAQLIYDGSDNGDGFGLRLQLVALPGDFDLNGIVDINDLLTWQRIDGSEAGLLQWQTAFVAASRSGVSSVPEPSSGALLAGLAVIGLALRRRSPEQR